MPSTGPCSGAAAAAKSLQLCLTLCDPIDSSPPGLCPWDSAGKNTGVGCHFLLQCVKVMSDSSRPHGLQPTRLLRPWDFPGKSTGVGCHCLLCLVWWWGLNWYYLWTLLGSHFYLLDKSSCVHICHLLAILLKWSFWCRSWAGLRFCISNRLPDSADGAGEVEGCRGEGVGTTLSSKIVTDHCPPGTHTPCNILASLTGLLWADTTLGFSLFLPQCPILWPTYVLATNFEWTDYDLITKDK